MSDAFATDFYLAAYVSPGYGLIAVYLTLINGIVHIVQSVIFRIYNPGLATSVLLFLPASVFAILTLQKTGLIEWYHHLLGILIAVGIHVVIVAYVKSRHHCHAIGVFRGFPKDEPTVHFW